VVYRKRPGRVDDLKRISGVAETLEQKLHQDGVYRFKQVALCGIVLKWRRSLSDSPSKTASNVKSGNVRQPISILRSMGRT
jgi:hypothetical protein